MDLSEDGRSGKVSIQDHTTSLKCGAKIQTSCEKIQFKIDENFGMEESYKDCIDFLRIGTSEVPITKHICGFHPDDELDNGG